MKGYRVSTGKSKVVYIYENVITEAERGLITKYYLPAGYRLEARVKDTAGIKERSEKNGFTSAVSKATRDELLSWVKANYPKEEKAWKKKLAAVSAGGLGFQKGKTEFKKAFPKYPEVEA